MIDVPTILDPPDIIVVDVLGALPGRPITGERLIRPDGTISLGFYGAVHVRGLTLAQAKIKIVLHLRRYLTDQLLGLTRYSPTGDPIAPAASDKSNVPTAAPGLPPDLPGNLPAPPPPAGPGPGQPTKPGTARDAPAGVKARLDGPQIDSKDVTEAFERLPRDILDPIAGFQAVLIDPLDSDYVFVDLASHNSKVYFVQGDVGTPGRLPITGRETVLDAMNYAGGFIPTAEPTDIHLYRPARGDQPARDYLIDYAAILKGDARANLQIFPNDRLVIGRNPIVQKTIEIDRAGALMHSVFNNYNYRNIAVRSVNPNQGTIDSISLSDWFETIWTEIAANPAILRDPEKFRESITRLLERTKPKQ